MNDALARQRPPQQRSRSSTRSLRPPRDENAAELGFKGMRYEHFKTGIPPRAVRSISDTASGAASLDTMAAAGALVDGDAQHEQPAWHTTVPHSAPRREFGSAQRPQTSPNASPRLPHDTDTTPTAQFSSPPPSFLDADFKRDSGIAPAPAAHAVVTSPRTQHERSPPGPVTSSPPAPPPLPAVVVQNDTVDEQPERSRYSLSAYRARRKASSQKPPLARPTTPLSKVRKMASFHGLDAAIPASANDEISLEDLASNKVEFSTRGSLMFGGKKMQELIGAQGQDYPKADDQPAAKSADDAETAPQTDSIAPSLTPSSPQKPEVAGSLHEMPLSNVGVASTTQDVPQVKVEAADNNSETPQESDEAGAAPETPTQPNEGPTAVKEKRKGLVAGRRKPSIQMLQAAIHGGRVLSAEEMTFSMKVRSMYEHGDERGANWGLPMSSSMSYTTSGKDTPDTMIRDTPTPEVVVHKVRSYDQGNNSDQWPLSDNRFSYISKYSRTSNELAGGIEDWENIDGSLVDRYGFIHLNRGNSSGSSKSGPDGGMQRVATSLRIKSQSRRPRERGLQRGLSSARSSRSLPPPSRDFGTRGGPGSVHSTYSTSSKSSRNPFRSRSMRLLAEASDMLSLPPGLADIAEAEDAGATASAQKQREWARGEKWQKMAKAVVRRNEGKGGGMHFEFDTTDPKLVERTWKGIPDRWRAAAWHSFLSESAKRRGNRTTDEELIGQFHKLQEMSCADDVQIDVDVPRTVQLHIMFRRRYRGGQRLLFRVLHAMALYFPEVGYVQGMASIAVTLLCYYDEENAFVMMVRLWQLRGLESFFTENFSGLMAALAEFEQDWLSRGDVATKLTDLGITSVTYGTRWYLTLFNMSVPFPAQLRIWDVFMLLGDAPNSTGAPNAFGGADLDVLHATSAALIDATREILIDSDFENAMKVLTSFVPIKDEDMLMKVAHIEYKLRKKRGNTIKA
ncbi:hypothetical protein CBER1_10383 [Cercospora berteroae]|uniref:Rab-GAP TBC domain-containing protein n=1 Tax=Cercospora berteroae TaxID=357750 RepID=A0A2S6BYB5_9PEZI|nr:hypothetical protein CBER1_10383 [Cercospora berteroae]